LDLIKATGDAEQDGFRAELRAALAAALGNASLELASVDRRGEGYSWETYLVSARISPGANPRVERFAVKREPSAGLLGTYDVQREVDLLNAAKYVIGCPVPRVVAFQRRIDGKRGFYVMEMIDGVVPMPWNVKKILPDADVRRGIGLELAGIMAKLHTTNVERLSIGGMSPPVNPESTGLDETRKWRQVYVESRSSHVPILDLAFAWLKYRADAVSGKVSLVHNDLRIGNVIVEKDHVAAVLDWETAEFTDPSADLAKFNLPTFRGRSTLSSGLIAWSEFLEAYAVVTGWTPTEAALNYWSVLEIAKTAVGALRGMHFFDSAASNDIRYANMRWQAHHSIKWLVELFESGTWGR
jgi:aminoglycoside phosphotransferase (APT) family kinase protein